MDEASGIDILLTGGDGQAGTELRRLAPPGWRIAAPHFGELDIADADAVRAYMGSRPWSAVINAAAYTAVDKAETEIAQAWRTNALGPAVLAEAAARAGAPIVQISTDYVFDGSKPAPYIESDPVAPLGVYGASKFAGEEAVRTGNRRHVILRTAWLVSSHGVNFVKTMLRLAVERPVLRVVGDQRGSPTSATDLAEALIAIVGRLIADPDTPVGTYHFVNDGEASWCDLAKAILARAEMNGLACPPLEAITTAEYPTAARRPANSRLATAKVRRDYGLAPRLWRPAIDEIVDRLLVTPAKESRL